MAGNGTSLTAMESEWGTSTVYALAILLGIFIVVACIGNLMVMLSIVITRRQCDRGYIFIFNLSVVDFLTSVCVMPISLVTLLNGHFMFSNVVCYFNGFTVQMLFITSIHTLMYMAVYRYMSICHPFTPVGLNKIITMIAASWILAVSVSCLSVDVLSHFLYKPYTTQCGPGYPDGVKGWINIAIVAGLCFILPLTVIVCVYVLIFRKAHKLFTRLEDPSYSNYSHEAHLEQRNLSITFIIIVVGFIICWTPIFVYLNYASIVMDKKSIPTHINPIVYWFSYLNSAINPLIYGLRTPIFKRLKDVISCHQGSPPANSFRTSQLSLSQSTHQDLSKPSFSSADVRVAVPSIKSNHLCHNNNPKS